MKRNSALIGWNGFIGSNIVGRHEFDCMYNSSSITNIRGMEFDLVICAGAPGIKWKANKFGEEDYKSIKSLMDELSRVKTKKFVLISTIDVYPFHHYVDEDTVIDKTLLNPYGLNRRILEEFVEANFDSTIIRLPSVFGDNMRGGLLYDLANDNEEYVTMGGVIQFYNLNNLWKDISIAMERNLDSLNIATEFIRVDDVKRIFGIDRRYGNWDVDIPCYNMKTKHAPSGYLYTKKYMIKEIKNFIS